MTCEIYYMQIEYCDTIIHQWPNASDGLARPSFKLQQ